MYHGDKGSDQRHALCNGKERAAHKPDTKEEAKQIAQESGRQDSEQYTHEGELYRNARQLAEEALDQFVQNFYKRFEYPHPKEQRNKKKNAAIDVRFDMQSNPFEQFYLLFIVSISNLLRN